MANTVPLEGFSKYTLDPSSLTVYNRQGRRVRPNVDARGRINVSLVDDRGKNRRVAMSYLLRSSVESGGNTSELTENEASLLATYYSLISPVTNKKDDTYWSSFLKHDNPDVTWDEIFEFLNRIRPW